MKWSVKIARLAGIDIRVHATFLLLLGWVAFVEYMARRTGYAVVAGLLLTVAIFFTIVLHELGHALVARRFGVPTREITLLPIGGVSRLERMPEEPRRELWIAIAGPLVSLAVAGVLYGALWLWGTPVGSGMPALTAGPFLWRLMWINVLLAGFNLLPAFPMDGGRVLRAALATRMSYARATQIAARTGQGLALLFGLAGLFWSPFLVFIALFVWMGATQESAEAQLRDGLEGTPVRAAMVTSFETLAPEEPLSRATELILAGAQEDFPVMESGKLVGILTRERLLKALTERGPSVPVSEAMDRELNAADPGEMLSDVLPRLRSGERRTIPVVRGGQVYGLLTLENVGDYLAIQAAMAGPQRPRPRPA